jgi:transposase-like protein
MAGTVFQDSKLPLTSWFRAMWQLTSQKNGVSALGLQRELGLGSYKTAWTMLHKLRRAMVRPGRERLQGIVEVDEAYWGGEEAKVRGRQTYAKARIAVAAEADGQRIGRIRLRHIADTSRKTLHGFIAEVIAPGSTVQTDGWPAYRELQGYVHAPQVQRRQPKDADLLLPRVHLVISLFKRWLLGTHQGAIAHDYLQDYLDEFTFRFNRRTSASRGKLFYRLVQQAVQVSPSTFDSITAPNP